MAVYDMRNILPTTTDAFRGSILCVSVRRIRVRGVVPAPLRPTGHGRLAEPVALVAAGLGRRVGRSGQLQTRLRPPLRTGRAAPLALHAAARRGEGAPVSFFFPSFFLFQFQTEFVARGIGNSICRKVFFFG